MVEKRRTRNENEKLVEIASTRWYKLSRWGQRDFLDYGWADIWDFCSFIFGKSLWVSLLSKGVSSLDPKRSVKPRLVFDDEITAQQERQLDAYLMPFREQRKV